MADRPQTVSVDGRRLRLTNLDKVLYPETGTTKADVLDYYARIADALIPHVRDRPLTRKRWVHGVGSDDEPGEVFFQKNLDDGTPDWVARHPLEHKSRSTVYPIVNDRATLAWLAQIAALELHVPQWRFDAHGEPRKPDRLVLDLDPGEGVGLLECAEIARSAREILQGMGLEPMPVTSGSKGIHLYARLDGSQTSDQVSAFAHELARALEADMPDLVVSDMKKTLRLGKVLVDWSQNSSAKTTIAPYSLRGRMQPMVAAPRTWDELDSPELRHLDYREVLERVEEHGDLLASLDERARDAGLEPTPERMATFEATPASKDRLEKYRSMRDAGRTPEPVPDAPAVPTEGRSFVIQEHHATRLHYDFRLEHDGVLVSWAMPKGPPTEPKKNHLAVHTEDHPLEYGTFEGTIPKGEYGGGVVTIWDSGTYELEKWRDDEVIVTLHGEPDGGLGGSPVKLALIRTGRTPDDEKNWLAHRMQIRAGGDADTETDTKTKTERSPKASGASTASNSTPDPATTARSTTKRATESSTGDARAALRKGPMLASLGTAGTIGGGAGWAFEMKWDGIRAIVDVRDPGADTAVTLRSRNGNDLTAAYPELAAIADATSGEAILDGEIVALDKQGRPDFGLLQRRMNLIGSADITRATRDVPVQFIVFDLLAHDGRSLLGDGYDERRSALEAVVHETGLVRVPAVFDSVETSLDEAMAISSRLGLEGVVAKKRASTYSPGRRSTGWLKLKHHSTQEAVIGGWLPGKGRREGGVGSLLLGIPGDGGLVYIGRVGTGFGDRDLDDLAARLEPLAQKTDPFLDIPRVDARDAHWTRPEIVGEVEFAQWTSTGRLRQPSWRGFRPDKAPSDVVKETP
ncbi:ATP-dependent DNA ligase [Amnibacterium flavum]|uniref:DNA ligase (ATP) n=1 Tax=Amnibacterium flavum TaxID=2173173 RepID=A0A2V1HR68_9MICO|nr:ATP-dependent DNA ligase [Amnibacterium flavum]PVZ93609.1 ATP-dependent DNA ligase [Amnibacterium flavum]